MVCCQHFQYMKQENGTGHTEDDIFCILVTLEINTISAWI